jgi:hypothetical protein
MNNGKGSFVRMTEPKGPLFHYTSIQGLIGILTGRKIWATSISHLNDKQELFQARDMFRQAIEALRKRISPSPEPAIHPPDYYKKNPTIAFLEAIYDLLDLAQELPIFVCSFSEEGDQLSQWRGYCPNAHGFSIGFDYTKLKNHADRQKFMVKKCIYQKREQQTIIDEYIENRVVPSLSSMKGSNETRIEVLTVFKEILEILPTMKNEHFVEESEWRLISSAFETPKALVKFRPGKTAIIPYCEFELAEEEKELPVECIKNGPTPNRDESLLSLKTLLNQQNMSKTTIVDHSKIPYREI